VRKLAGRRDLTSAFKKYRPRSVDQAKHATPVVDYHSRIANQPEGFAALDVKVDTVDSMDAAG